MGGASREEDDLADHAAAPHLRKRWKCPACGKTMMAFYQEIDRHRERAACPRRSGTPPRCRRTSARAGGSGPSLQEELAGGANLGSPHEGRCRCGRRRRRARASSRTLRNRETIGRKSIPQPQVRSRRARQACSTSASVARGAIRPRGRLDLSGARSAGRRSSSRRLGF